MIDIRDLRIGNIVYTKAAGETAICSVVGLMPNGEIMLKDLANSIIYSRHDLELLPVSLNVYTLSLIGFIETKFVHYNAELNSVTFKGSLITAINNEILRGLCDREIQSIHEIQNVYHAMYWPDKPNNLR